MREWYAAGGGNVEGPRAQARLGRGDWVVSAGFDAP